MTKETEMKKIVIHAGATKTGTSAIQVALAQNHAVLRAAGIVAPEGRKFEKRLAGIVSGGNAFEILKFIASHGRDPEAAAARLATWLDDESSAEGCHTLVVSGEAIPGKMTDASGHAMARVFRDKGFEVQVLFYVRSLAGHALSQYGEYVKRRKMRGSFSEFTQIYDCPFQGYVSQLEEVFGRDVVEVVSYDAERGDLWGGFMSRLSSTPVATQPPQVVNRSLCREEINLIRELNLSSIPRVVMAKSVTRYLSETTAPSKNRICVYAEDVEVMATRNAAVVDYINARLPAGTQLVAAYPGEVSAGTRAEEPADQPLPYENLQGFLSAVVQEIPPMPETKTKAKARRYGLVAEDDEDGDD